MVTHVVGAFTLALAVNGLKSRAVSYFARTSLFFPFVISWAAVALLWRYVLSPSFGLLSYYAGKLGFTPPDWFNDPQWTLPAIIGIDWWHTIGFTFVIMLAGLQAVPQELVEAARTDGAGWWRILWNVTIPMMSPTIFFVTVITFLGAFQIFDPMQIITPGGGPDKSTLTIVMYLYQRGLPALHRRLRRRRVAVDVRDHDGRDPAAVRRVPAVGAPELMTTTIGRRWPRWLLGLGLTVLGVLMLAPLVWMIAESLTDEKSPLRLPPNWIPKPFTLDNYRGISGLIPFGRMALNSLIVATIATAGSLLVSVLAAYALSRLRFPGRELIFIVLLSALMIPGQMTIIPVFVLMRNLHLINTLPSLWIPALINVFAIFFFRQYFNTIPRELDEAARIDGANNMWILFRVILPLSGPAIAAVAILTFEASWNSYFVPLIFISSEDKMTLPLGLVTLNAGQGGSSVIVFAAITAVVVPVLIVFLAFQRLFVASIASVGIRG